MPMKRQPYWNVEPWPPPALPVLAEMEVLRQALASDPPTYYLVVLHHR